MGETIPFYRIIMAITVIVKNNTGNPVNIDDIGVSLSASEIRTLSDYFDYNDLMESDDLISFVNAGTLTINNGSTDLSIADALDYLQVEVIPSEGGEISTTLAYAGVTRTTEFQLATSFVNTIYDTEDYHSDRSVVESGLTSNGDRLLVKENGLYQISNCYFVRANNPNFIDSFYRVMKNDSEQIGYISQLNTYTTEIQQVALCMTVPLSAGDYITSQARCETGSDCDITGSRFQITKLEGVQGPAGAPGGTTIDVRDDGTLITSSTSTLNFRGNGVVVSDAGSNQANIDINSNVFEPKYIQVRDTNGGQDMNTTNDEPIIWNVQDIRDTDTFNHATGAGEIYILTSGWYDCSYSMSYDGGDNSRKNVLTYLVVNDNNILTQTYCYTYVRNNTNDNGTNQIGGVLIQLNAGDYVELKGIRAGDSGTANTIAGTSWLKMKLIREV